MAAACESAVARMEADIARAEAALDSWISSQKAAMTAQKEQQTLKMNENKENTTRVRTELNTLADKQLADGRVAEKQRKEISSLEEEISTMSSEHQRWKDKHAELEQALEAARQEKAKYEADLAKHSASTKDRLSEIKSSAQLYEEHLGLRFESVAEGVLRFCFTRVDAENWDRAFIMTLTIDSQGKYSVNNTAPSLKNVDTLVDEVNKTGDFAAFVQGIRAQFKAMC